MLLDLVGQETSQLQANLFCKTERTQSPPEPETISRNPTPSLSVLEPKAAAQMALWFQSPFLDCACGADVAINTEQLPKTGPGTAADHCSLSSRGSIQGALCLRLLAASGLASTLTCMSVH